jgi:DDE superfamily endonuclease
MSPSIGGCSGSLSCWLMRPGPVGTRRVIDGVLMRLQSCRALVYLYRAIDQYGQAIEVLVSQWRDLVAACQFSAHAPPTRSTPGRGQH